MTTTISLAAGIILSGLSLACSAGRAVEARSDGLQPAQRMSKVALRPAGEPLLTDWRSGNPSSFENLTLIPVTSDDTAATDAFITLDQGLQSGTVTVTELGADGRTQGVRPREQSGDTAEVNRLSLTNRSGKLLVLIAGEILSGGKQDCIVGSDRIVKPDNSPIPLDVFCVEHGRWAGGPAFGQRRASPPSGIGNGPNAIIRRGTGGTDGIAAPESANGAPAMALPSVREKAEAKKSQPEVWAKVAETTETVNVNSSTGALTKAYDDGRVNSDLDRYERALRDKVAGKNVVGVVVGINGKPISADVFASPALFQGYWPKLLKSYALEAISQDRPKRSEIDPPDASFFLSRVLGRNSSEGQDGLYRLTEHQSGNDSSFELEYTAMSPPLLVHFNRVVGR
jgi:hypothetical protein